MKPAERLLARVIKRSIFWDATRLDAIPCCVVEVYCEQSSASFLLGILLSPEDGVNMFLRNVDELVPGYCKADCSDIPA
jgi:hypothetical protein